MFQTRAELKQRITELEKQLEDQRNPPRKFLVYRRGIKSPIVVFGTGFRVVLGRYVIVRRTGADVVLGDAEMVVDAAALTEKAAKP